MRLRLLGLLLSGVVVASSACSDATAPTSFAGPESASLSKSGNNGNGNWDDDVRGTPIGSSSYSVTIDPRRDNDVRFGDHTVSLPANSICSAASGYGLGLWDDDCTPEQKPVTITAKVTTSANGYPRIDFSPEMRFSPNRTVTLSLSLSRNLKNAAKNWRILYCATELSICIDESLTDRSLATKVDRKDGSVYRRIKHFSGYFVAE